MKNEKDAGSDKVSGGWALFPFAKASAIMISHDVYYLLLSFPRPHYPHW